MADYQYQQNVWEGASYGYVKYDIEPAFGTPVSAGQMVKITGQAYYRSSAMKSLSVGTRASGSNRYFTIDINIPRGQVTNFSMVFPMWTLSNAWGSTRTVAAPLDFTFWQGTNGSGSGVLTQTVSGQGINYLTYRIDPVSRFADFERYMLIDGAYEANDEGTALIGQLQIGLAAGRDETDITIATVKVSDDTGVVGTLALSQNLLAAALSQAGYVETIPTLFANMTFNTSSGYTLEFRIGDAYDVAVFTVEISRAFANVHLSGARNGGVAFGKFSSATDSAPLFECMYPAKFYDRVEFANAAGLIDLIHPINSIYITMSNDDPNTLFAGTTWVKIENAFLLGSGTRNVGDTGGSETAVHNHIAPIAYNSSAVGSVNLNGIISQGQGKTAYLANISERTSSLSTNITALRTKDTTIDTMPPYITVGIWRRTA